MRISALFVVILFFCTTTSFAHIEEGTWKGVNSANGSECTLQVFEQTFETGTPHPLNERIRVQVSGEEYQIYHPRSVDTATGAVSFNHDFFEAVRATAVGSNSLVVEMVHTPAFEGPSAYKWTKHNWRTRALETLDCQGLKHFP